MEDKDERISVEARLETLRSKVGDLTIQCPSGDCRVTVDGIERGKAPVTVVLDSGRHRVEAFVDGEKIAALDARVVSGEDTTVELFASGAKEVVVEETGPVEEAEPEETRRLGAGFWISSGVTAAAGIMAIAFGAKTMKDKEKFDDSGRTDKLLKDQGEKDRITTNVMLAVTAVGAACAVTFLILDLKSNGEEESEQEETEVALVPGPGFGLGLAGSF